MKIASNHVFRARYLNYETRVFLCLFSFRAKTRIKET